MLVELKRAFSVALWVMVSDTEMSDESHPQEPRTLDRNNRCLHEHEEVLRVFSEDVGEQDVRIELEGLHPTCGSRAEIEGTSDGGVSSALRLSNSSCCGSSSSGSSTWSGGRTTRRNSESEDTTYNAGVEKGIVVLDDDVGVVGIVIVFWTSC